MTTQKKPSPEREQSKPNLGQQDAKTKDEVADGMSDSGSKQAKGSSKPDK
jgi:hypothetical protein